MAEQTTTRTPPQPRPPMKARVEIPKPPIPSLERYTEVGDTVEWYPGADKTQQPYCGVATKVGLDDTLTVNRCSPDLCDTAPQDGCRHIDDPKAQHDAFAGGWRHRRITVGTRAMLLKLGVLKWEFRREWVLVFNPEALVEPEAPKTPVQ